MAMDKQSMRRRYWRNYRRKSRRDGEAASSVARRVPPSSKKRILKKPAATSHRSGSTHKRILKEPAAASDRLGSRHRLFPCCGKRRNQCKCDWSDIARRVRKGPWGKFQTTVAQSTLLTGRDTQDTGYFVQRYGVDAACPIKCCFGDLWFRCLVFKHFNRVSTWERIVHCIPISGRQTQWAGVRKALEQLYAAGEPVFGGTFYHSTLKAYRSSPTAAWTTTAKLPEPHRELLSLQKLHEAIPRDLMAAYDRSPSRKAWAAWYDEFMSRIGQSTQGLFGDYSMKCALDILLLSGQGREQDLSRWPVQCGGYSEALASLFKDLPMCDRRSALDWIYREMAIAHGGKLRFPEVCMHLCWNSRRDRGILDDAIST